MLLRTEKIRDIEVIRALKEIELELNKLISTREHIVDFLNMIDGMTAPDVSTGRALIYVDTADGDLKIKFGDDTVKTIVVDT